MAAVILEALLELQETTHIINRCYEKLLPYLKKEKCLNTHTFREPQLLCNQIILLILTCGISSFLIEMPYI